MDLNSIANDPRTDGFTGADLKLLVNEALKVAFREKIKTVESISSTESIKSADSSESSQKSMVKLIVTKDHFEQSLSRIRSSVDKVDRGKYNEMARKYSSMAQ